MKIPKTAHLSIDLNINEEEMEYLKGCETQEHLEEALKEYIHDDLDYIIKPNMINITFHD